ncbi:MAG TPA: hypothetical protein VII98_03480 [Solirubrobacteraceae bacterium]
MRHHLALLLALALGALSAGLVACGSSSKLLPANDAAAMDNALANVSDATAAGDCAKAVSALHDAQQAYASLPASVDAQLSARIRQGLAALASTVPTQCKGATTPAPTPTPSTTGSSTATPTTTTGTTTTTTTTPTTTTSTGTTTTTTSPTTTSTTTPTNPGGVSPDQTTTGAK